MTHAVLQQEAGYIHRDKQGRKITYVYGEDEDDIRHQLSHILASFDENGNPFYMTEEGCFTVCHIGLIQVSRRGYDTVDTHGVRCGMRVPLLLGRAVRPNNPRTRDWILKIS